MFFSLFDNTEKEDRSHQDNFYGKDWNEDGFDNGNYQYCPHCGKMRRFIWDRCDVCKGN